MSKLPGFGWVKPVFQLGRGKTLAVPMETHAMARKKLVSLFAAKGTHSGILLFKGGEQENQYDSDTELLFRQDSWFNYLFGVKESGFYGAICLSSGKTTLFLPKLADVYKIWCGEIYPPEYFKNLYGVEDAQYTDDLKCWMQSALVTEAGKIHVMQGTNSDSGSSAKPARFPGDEEFWNPGAVSSTDTHAAPHHLVQMDLLYNLVAQSRVLKNQEEVQLMRYVAWVGSMAHVEVMKFSKNCSNEYELEAKFLYEIYAKGGCRRCAYTSICACGPNSAVLHYGHAGAPNDRQLQSTDIALLDMGAEYHGYVSDITCSWPLSGKFSSDQKFIYEAVLSAQKAVYAHMKPGNQWTDCHLAAERAILTALKEGGLLINGTVDEFVQALLGPVFFPHGLGHLIGCDTHDVGSYIPGTPARSTRPGLSKLRTSRVLEVGMVLTNEPGCYFIDVLLNNALADPEQAKYINVQMLERFRHFGGVRIEDVVLVTENGPETLSTCPRTVQEIEDVLAGGQWPPARDACPELYRSWTRLSANANSMESIKL